MNAFGYEPLLPNAFLERAALVHRERTAVVEESTSRTYGELHDRSTRLAGALERLGVQPGDRVSVLAPNSSMALEAHFGIPWAGAVINALNTRLSAAELAYILDHAEPTAMLVDPELAALAHQALSKATVRPHLLGSDGLSQYESALTSAEPTQIPIADEMAMMSLNYTSGTTGRPKGVMYSHRGAYLQALAMVAHTRLNSRSKYLWTVPLFHCNGWCFPWAVTAVGAQHVTIRRPDPDVILDAFRNVGITHMSAAPTVLARLVSEADAPSERTVSVLTGGAPPSPALLARLDALNLDVTHLYGLTETYGPAALCEWLPEWDDADHPTRTMLKARQGVANLVSQPIRVWAEGRQVPADGSTVGEVQLRGNTVMLGYYRDPAATEAATCNGYFRSGDLGVVHPNGYIELRDRSKDVIISGGENITSIEVEQALDAHPAVRESAVVGVPDKEWGETVVAFVALNAGQSVTEAELRDFVRQRIASFKTPRRIVFSDLPKTGTGKIQKFLLRQTVVPPESPPGNPPQERKTGQ